MVALLLYMAALAIALREARGARHSGPERVPGLLARTGLLFALRHALGQLEHVPMSPPLLAATRISLALVSLLLWAQLAGLAWFGPRTKAVRVRWVFGGIAALLAITHAPGTAIAIVSLPAVLSFGWLAAIRTRQRFASALVAIALVVGTLALRVPGEAAQAAGGWAKELAHFTQWARIVAFAYVGLGIFRTLDAFVQDPSLGIRTIRRRLALSHVLVVGVPLLIVIALWTMTTWLGVTSERSMVAMHAIDADGRALRTSLAQALRTPGDARAALGAVAASRRDEWPNVRVWRIADGRMERVAGEPVYDEAALATWRDSLAIRHPWSLVELIDGQRYLGAVASDSAGTYAVALVPVGEAIAGMPSRVAGATLWMSAREPVDTTEVDEADGADSTTAHERAADSIATARARRVARAFGLRDSGIAATASRPASSPAAQLTMGGDTLELGGRSDSTFSAGGAIVPGMRHDHGWSQHSFYLRARVPLLDTLIGLYRSARENPMNFLLIMILAGLVLLVLPVAAFNFRLVRQLGRSVMQPVGALREGTRALAEARLDYRIPVKGDDELWDAAQAFNTMSEGLERARETELARDRMEQELSLARRIQQRLLPAGPPNVPGVEIAGLSAPAREVGGDYFDHLPLPGGRVLLVIADVSGKGVPAALLMSAFRASLVSQDTDATPPDQVATRLNEFLHDSVEPGRFVTAFLGVLDPATGRLAYTNAGHNPPAIVRADGRVEWLGTGGLIFGIMSGAHFDRGESTLAPGDLLALYTDGVTEGADASGEQFGEDRLVVSLRAQAAAPLAALAESLVDEVRTFEGASGPADDLTVLLARISPKEPLAV